MAVPNHASSPRSTPLLHRSITDGSLSAENIIRLPNGSCNFGDTATRCGCRRFWSEQIDTSSGRKSWCMCEHHACYHDPGTVDLSSESIHVYQAARTPPLKIEPLTQKGLTEATAHSRASSEVSSAIRGTSHDGSFRREPQSSDSRIYFSHLGQTSLQIPESFPWPQPSLPGNGSLPPIPAQCLLPGLSPSHSSQSAPRAATPQNSVLKTASTNGCRTSKLHTACQNTAQSEDYIESATEPATPTPRPSPDLGLYVTQFDNILTQVEARIAQQPSQEPASIPPVEPQSSLVTRNFAVQDIIEGNPLSAVRVLLEPLHTIAGYLRTYVDLMHVVEGHGDRLEGLEMPSFSEPDLSHVNNQLEDLDTRVSDLDNRILELERTHDIQQNASFNESFCSTTSSAMIAAAIDRVDTAATTGNQELKARLQAMEEQLKELQAATMPTRSRPWEIEVIFLPFGANLKGIWSTLENFPPSQRSRNNSMASDDASQTTVVCKAQAEIDRHQERWEDVVNSEIQGEEDNWLVPKACGIGSRVYERLRSRGMVRTVEVISSDARDLQTAIYSAFGELSGFISTPMTSHEASPQFMGLQAMFIPLRKIHKDSRLRFLQPEEMVTPALWTPSFIHASVAMRAAGIRRLFVTNRDSYLQNDGGHQHYWTWQIIRELDRVHPEPGKEIGEADALEACWEYDERLDDPPEPSSVHTSFSSQHSSLSIRPAGYPNFERLVVSLSPSDHFSSQGVSPVVSEPPENPRRTKSPTLSRSTLQRNVSMPQLVPLKGSPTLSKRRIPSPEEVAEASSSRPVSLINLKRRRVSKSPSRPRDTPRWSIDPPSPFINEQIAQRKRSTTPFGFVTGYATPHSGTHYADIYSSEATGMEHSGSDGSTTDDAEAELASDDDVLTNHLDQGHQPEDVWEGMEEELASSDDDDEGLLEGVEEEYLQKDFEQRDFDERSDSAPSEYPIGVTLPESQEPQDEPEVGVGFAADGSSFYVHLDEDA